MDSQGRSHTRAPRHRPHRPPAPGTRTRRDDETPMNATEQAPGQAGPRILLVEDEPRIRDFTTRALVTAGYGVAAAGNGTEGLRLALAGDYDLVILDLIMPDLDERLVLAKVRRDRRERAVLGRSCLADVTTKADCLDPGAQDYLTKPFSLAELRARVRVRLREEVPSGGEVLRAGAHGGEVRCA